MVIIAVLLPVGAFLILLLAIGLHEFYGARVNKAWFFTTVKEGTLKEIVINGDFQCFIPNMNGKRYNPITHKIENVALGEDKPNRFTQNTGLYFKGTNPLRTVRVFPIQKVRLKPNIDLIPDIREKIDIDQKETDVDHLLMVIKRPILMVEVDLKDNTRVYLLIQGIYDVYDPYLMLEELDAKFFEPLDGIVRAYIVSKYRGLEFKDLGTLTARPNLDELVGPYNIEGLIGLTPKSLVIEDFSISEKDKARQEAAEATVIAKEKATARHEEGVGEADYQLSLATAKAQGAALLDKAQVAGDIAYLEKLNGLLTKEGVAHVLGRMHMPQVTTLVESGYHGNLSMMLPTDPKKPNQSPTTSGSETESASTTKEKN